MKNELTKNLGLRILSLFFAICVWVVIVSIDDPQVSTTFKDIPVKTVNESAITTINQVYTVLEGNTVDITVTGKQSIIDKIHKSDLKAEADLSNLSKTNAVEIVPTCMKYSDENIELTLGKTKMMKVSLENKKSSKFQIEIKQIGDVDSGYYISEKLASPNIIEVEGAESVINKIAELVVEVDVNGRIASFTNLSVPKVYDNNGDLIDSSNLHFSTNEVSVNVKLEKTKEVPLIINPVGDTKMGYKRVAFFYEPKKITVAGSEEALANVSYISINYDITGRFEDFEDNVSIADEIKAAGVKPIDENQTVAISAKFERLRSEEVSIGSGDITVKNVPTGYEAVINTESIVALVQGSSESVKSLQASDLEPYIDVEGYRTGTHLFPVMFKKSNSYKLLNKPTVNITIQKKDS